MSVTISKVKKFFSNKFKGNKKPVAEYKNDVHWEAVSNEDKSDNEEDRCQKIIATFSKKVAETDQEHVTRIQVGDESIHVIRASVYVNNLRENDSGEEETPEENSSNLVDSTFPKVNSNSKLIDMDAEGIIVDFSEDETPSLRSSEEVKDQHVLAVDHTEGSSSKMCFGPELNFNINAAIRKPSALSTFVEDIENELRSSFRAQNINNETCKNEIPTCTGEYKFESSNSLDIEKELDNLMGTLCLDLTYHNDTEPQGFHDQPFLEKSNDGSRINMAFATTEPVELLSAANRHSQPLAPELDNYWTNQRLKSKSVAERCKLDKLMKRGKQRMSMIELRNKRKSANESESATLYRRDDIATGTLDLKPSFFTRIACDRSSFIEPRVSAAINLTPRPQSALDNIHCSSVIHEPIRHSISTHSSDGESKAGNSSVSPRLSKSLNDSIDWSWLEEAMNSLNSEHQEPQEENQFLRVDVECQTQLEQSWQGEGERMRDRPSSPRLTDAAVGVNSECRIVDERGIRNKDMAGKAFVEGGGTSGPSSWLRQSMRRVRHFNLEDPTRIRSAPPDGLCRVSRTDGDETNGIVNQSVVNNRLTARGNNSQRVGNDGLRSHRRRNRSRSRPSSAPERRPASDGVNAQPNQQQQEHHQRQTETETVSLPQTNDALDNLGYESDSTDRHPSPRGRRHRVDEESEESEGRSPLGPWPHGLSSVFAGLGCTLGLFNISRFAVLSVHFGSNFIIQFLLLSFLLGIPLLAFHAALGQTLGAGPVDMWKISPLFQGIGVALLLAQALIGMYSIVGVSWMFVYFRDSFITKQDSFRWAEPFRHYRQDNIFATSILNMSGRLEETVPDYLNVVVLQRHGLTSPENAYGHLKFQLTFNLAVVWMIVFVSLSKGLRSYGKVVYVFSVLPVFGVLIICSKLLGLTPIHRGFFPQTEWSEFFLNAKSWISAATEVMLTWNLLGVATMQVTSHNRSSKKLWRDVATIILLTILVLILAAFLGNLCHQLISLKGYSYVPSSFERISTYSFLRPSGALYTTSYSMPVRHMSHASLVAGERVSKPGALHESGYQVLRLATELVPTTLAILEGNYLSPFWAVLFYFTLILFGIAQQLAIWHCVITGIMAINAPILKSWETTITFFTCAAGFILGLPMTTELGIFVVYFLDYCLGGGWWVILLTLIEICAILMVRGRPYSGENISIALFGKNTNCFSVWAIPLLTFTWNVILPVALLVMSITIFKSGGYRDLWIWRCGKGDYWPLWTREFGVFIQVIPLLCIPIVGLVQCYRYLSTGPADIFDRLANLYRPPANISGIIDEESTTTTSNIPPLDSGTNSTTELPAAEDPPPKYTPPPSYSTATGARIAKLLRQSFRRSVRRIQTALGQELTESSEPPPPDYASVLVEINHNRNSGRETNNTSSQPPTSAALTFTAADVAQVLRCSFRRAININSQNQHQQTSQPQPQQADGTTSNNPQNLVINSHENQ